MISRNVLRVGPDEDLPAAVSGEPAHHLQQRLLQGQDPAALCHSPGGRPHRVQAELEEDARAFQ